MNSFLKDHNTSGFRLPDSVLVQIIKIKYFHVCGLEKRNPGNQVSVSGMIPVDQDWLNQFMDANSVSEWILRGYGP